MKSKTALKTVTSIALAISSSLFGPVFAASAEESHQTEMLDGKWHVYSANGKVSIGWDLGTSATTALSVEGEEVVSGDDVGHYYIQDATPGDRLVINLEASTAPNDKEIQKISADQNIDAATASAQYEHLEVSGLTIQVPGYSSSATAYAATTLPSATLLRYQTFIPFEYVSAPIFCHEFASGDYFFNGNNRGFDPNSSEVKTRMDIHVDWTNSGSLTPRNYVGLTKLFKLVDGVYDFQRSDRAETTSMGVFAGSQSSTRVDFRMAQDVANPMCPEFTAGIHFDFQVSIWRSGAYTLSGNAIKVPTHEAYFKDSNQPNWFAILKTGMGSEGAFWCFTPYYTDVIWCNQSHSLSWSRY